MGGYFLVYGVLALSHILVQLGLGHAQWRRSRRRFGSASTGAGSSTTATPPSVTVVLAAYNETPWILARSLLALTGLTYPALEIIVVDDGSPNRAKLAPIYEMFERDGLRIIMAESNRGKREAQRLAFDIARGDFIITIDSDTVVPPDSIPTLLAAFEDDDVGAATANIGVANADENLLTRLIGYRYWMAFNQERAAQSLFGVMLCCSGPYSCYRRGIVERVKERYTSQRFLGRKCTFGDDRHLTNLVLDAGYKAVYVPQAAARTYVPNSLGKYLRQQLRWNKSFYREGLWSIRLVPRRHPYLTYELLMDAVLPFMLLTAIAGVAVKTANEGVGHLYVYLAIVLAIGFIRSLYGLLRTREAGFLLFLLYGFVHLTLLIPTRLYALATLRRQGWGTRGTRPETVGGSVGA